MSRRRKRKGYKIRYQTITVTLPVDPRKHRCDACGKSVELGEIKTTQLHHWKYAWKPVTIKKEPSLALQNTSELCFYCHQIADGVRALLRANPKRVAMVISLLSLEDKQRFDKIIQLAIKYDAEKMGKMRENTRRFLESLRK